MTTREFRRITRDIEKHLEGEGYWIRVYLVSGHTRKGSWIAIDPTPNDVADNRADPALIRIDTDDFPPFYVNVREIVAVELTSD